MLTVSCEKCQVSGHSWRDDSYNCQEAPCDSPNCWEPLRDSQNCLEALCDSYNIQEAF